MVKRFVDPFSILLSHYPIGNKCAAVPSLLMTLAAIARNILRVDRTPNIHGWYAQKLLIFGSFIRTLINYYYLSYRFSKT
jgi:hypothetical protein